MRRAKHACALFPIAVAVSLSARRPLRHTYLESSYCLPASGDVIVIVAAACRLSTICCWERMSYVAGVLECNRSLGLLPVWLPTARGNCVGKDEAVKAANRCCTTHCCYSRFRIRLPLVFGCYFHAHRISNLMWLSSTSRWKMSLGLRKTADFGIPRVIWACGVCIFLHCTLVERTVK